MLFNRIRTASFTALYVPAQISVLSVSGMMAKYTGLFTWPREFTPIENRATVLRHFLYEASQFTCSNQPAAMLRRTLSKCHRLEKLKYSLSTRCHPWNLCRDQSQTPQTIRNGRGHMHRYAGGAGLRIISRRKTVQEIQRSHQSANRLAAPE